MRDLYELFLAYEGPDRPNFVERYLLQQNFIRWREKYAEIFNEHIEEWNAKFDKVCPGLELSIDGEVTENDIKYGRFLKKCAEPYFSKERQPLITFEVNDGIAVKDCVGDLIGRFKHKKCIVHAYFRKVEA